MDADLNFRGDWAHSLGEESSPYAKQVSKFNSLAGLVKSYGELEKLRGIPNDATSPEGLAAYRSANGIPSEVADYQAAIPLPQMEEGVEIPATLMEQISKTGLDNNLTPQQMGAMVDLQLKLSAGAMEAGASQQAQDNEAAFSALEKQWGGDPATHYANASAAAELLGLDPSDPAIGDNPALVSALSKMHRKLDEDTLRGAAGNGPTGGATAESWRQKARDIVTNPDNALYEAYKDPSHPQNEHANRTVDEYNAKATGFQG